MSTAQSLINEQSSTTPSQPTQRGVGVKGIPWAWGALWVSIAALALAGPLWLIFAHGTSAPITDEWLLVTGRHLFDHEFAKHPLRTLQALLDLRVYEHRIGIPTLYYLAVTQLTHFDARWLTITTLICGITNILLICSPLQKGEESWMKLAVVSAIILAPLRYMDWLWGFQFTLAFSILPAIAALKLASEKEKPLTQVIIPILLCIVALWSSAGGLLALPSLTLVLLLRRGIKCPLAWGTLALGLFFILSFLLHKVNGRGIGQEILGPRPLLFISSATGACLTSFSAPFQIVIATGAFLILGGGYCLLLTIKRTKAVSPTTAFISGLLAMYAAITTSIAISRPYLGVWHLQYPCYLAVAGYLGMYEFLKTTKKKRILSLSLLAILAMGNALSIKEEIPEYLEYITSVENYMITLEENPEQKKPYPPTGGWDYTVEIGKYLKSHGCPLFKTNGE